MLDEMCATLDVILGSLVVNDDDLHQRLAFIQNAEKSSFKGKNV